MKIEVRKRGTKYTLNGDIVEPQDFLGIGGFKFSNHLWGWISGGAKGIGGGQHLSNAKRYIETEVLGNGCRRMRAPVELTLWTGPYFDVAPNAPKPWAGWSNIANGLDLVDLRVGTGSGFSLTPAMKKLIRMYVNLGREFGIVIEVPWLWTIKSTASGEALSRLGLDSDPRERFGVDVWNEHFLAAHGIGAYLRKLRDEGDGEGEHRVDPGGLNILSDLMNEYTAHVPKIWDSATLRNVARRWKVRDTQGELSLISQSGPADQYDPPLASQHGDQGFDAVCSHPPRGGEWAKTGDVLRRTWPNELIDVNESQMGWTEEQRQAWVGLIPKWAGLGTTDMDAWERMHRNFLANGIYDTFHTHRAMDGGWPPTPQTIVEQRIREITNAGPAPPPPPPTRMRRYERVISQAYEEILEREPDEGGLDGYNEAMLRGMSEAQVREALIRSDEYEERNPEK